VLFCGIKKKIEVPGAARQSGRVCSLGSSHPCSNALEKPCAFCMPRPTQPLTLGYCKALSK
jgi:hypothetical protein